MKHILGVKNVALFKIYFQATMQHCKPSISDVFHDMSLVVGFSLRVSWFSPIPLLVGFVVQGWYSELYLRVLLLSPLSVTSPVSH